MDKLILIALLSAMFTAWIVSPIIVRAIERRSAVRRAAEVAARLAEDVKKASCGRPGCHTHVGYYCLGLIDASKITTGMITTERIREIRATDPEAGAQVVVDPSEEERRRVFESMRAVYDELERQDQLDRSSDGQG